jgi:hypothetical protein
MQRRVEAPSVSAPARGRDGARSRLEEVHEGPLPAKPSGPKFDAVTRAPAGHKVSVDEHGLKTETRWIGIGGFGFQRESQTWSQGGSKRTVTRVKLPFFRRQAVVHDGPRHQSITNTEVVTARTNPLTGRTATMTETVRAHEGMGVEVDVVRDKVKSSRSGRLLVRDTTAKTLEKSPFQVESWSPEHTASATTDRNGVTSAAESVGKKYVSGRSTADWQKSAITEMTLKRK